MSKKKVFALAGSILILGLGLSFGQEKSRVRDRNEVRNEIATQAKSQARNRVPFVDENGDGICDYYRDHDGDGIPNGQDPDWMRPEDGTGYKNRHGNKFSNQVQHGERLFSGKGWSKASFRRNFAQFGRGVCDGLGPKGKAQKIGRR